MRTLAFVCLMCCAAVAGIAQTKTTAAKPISAAAKKPLATARLVQITTNYGTMVVKLYDSTPLHRDNFVRLVQEGFYDSLLFHRVIDGFMIQGGDPESRHAPDSVQLGGGSAPGERIPAEFNPRYFNKKGALAAARDDNPEKASSNCQFYIVQGVPVDTVQLNMMECQVRGDVPSFSYSDVQRSVYHKLGGTPFLDQNYTVFGEVVKGLDVIDKIAAVPRNENDRPLQNVVMSMKLLN